MRLNSIKLSGFKSFAEPTNFLLPGQLVGVVGPNGCGKSNIMVKSSCLCTTDKGYSPKWQLKTAKTAILVSQFSAQ